MIALKPYAWLDLSGSQPKFHFAILTNNGLTNHSIRAESPDFDSTDPKLFVYNFSCAADSAAPEIYVSSVSDPRSASATRIALRLFSSDGKLLGSITLTVDSTLYTLGYGGTKPYCYLQTTITPRLKLYVTSQFTVYGEASARIDSGVLVVIIPVSETGMLTGGQVDKKGCKEVDLTSYDITAYTHISVYLKSSDSPPARSAKGKGTTTQTDSDSSGAD